MPPESFQVAWKWGQPSHTSGGKCHPPKNWLLVGEAEAGELSVIIYSFIECCPRRGVDPFACLRDILTRLPDTGPGSNRKSYSEVQLMSCVISCTN